MESCACSTLSAGQQKKTTAFLHILISLSLISLMAVTAQAATTPQVSAGSSSDGSSAHTLALKSDGTVWAWGDNTYGQLGDATPDINTGTYITSSAVPVQVTGLTNIKAIAAGMGFSMALDNSGTVFTWGLKDLGQLGLGDATNRFTAVQALTGITGIAAGAYHALALESTTSVLAWGLDACGQLGDGVAIPSFCILSSYKVIGNAKTKPQPIANLTGVSSVAAGSYHSLAIMSSDGSVKAWGWNSSGQLGNGATTDSSIPEAVSNLTGATGLGAGSGHSVAFDGNHAVWAWGDNLQGQLGNGGTTNSDTPVNVLSGAAGVTAAGYYTAAWKSDGTVWTWGENFDGQLGNGTTTPDSTTATPTPAQVPSFSLGSAGCSATGDVNGDGVVDIFDVIKALRFAAGLDLTTASPSALANADMNCDGVIDIFDVIKVLIKASK